MKFEIINHKSYILFALLLWAQIGYANVIVGQAAIPDGYYNAVDTKKNADNILNALNGIIDNHTVIAYSGLEPYYEQTDFYNDTLWDMYSTCTFYMSHANIAQKYVCDGWNKEHLVCQSWLGSGPMVSDLFNVYPTDARINNLRSNYAYGVVGGSFSGFSGDPQHHGLGKLGTSTTSGIGTVYEPADEYKGDFARSFFYMVARYRSNTLNSGNGSKMFTSSPTNLTAYSLSFLLDWHRQDPVSQKEIDRNQAVYGIQHNRNPFIDYPELVEYIWGNRVGQAIDLSSMTPTCEGGGYDPSVTVKYGVTWFVSGTALYTDSVIAGRAVMALPSTPASCSSTSDVFMGWTNAPLTEITDQRPAVLYTQASDIPVVTEDRTYYAVFAHAEVGAVVEPAVYTYDENNQDGWTNTASMSGSYWLLDKGKTLVSPEIDLAGLSSIEVNIRTYGGTQYCNLDVTANGQAVATIVATNGKTLTDYTWTNTNALSGRAPLTFSTNYNTGQGIGFTRVVINATGSGTTYSAYLTNCGTSDIENHKSETINHKFIKDGQLFILVGDHTYTVTGQRVN
ncbi:MAG: endonuclease [Paludibacteraceae bacterium]|nr:endonuclease [Paludibacteraceae bacterium]